MKLKSILFVCGISILLASCNKEKHYPKNIDGTWELHSIQTLEIEGNKVNEDPLGGDSFIRIIFDNNSSTFDTYFSWDQFNSYSEGNGGNYAFSQNYSKFTMSLGQTEVIVYDIIKLGTQKMILQSEQINSTDGLLHLEEYVYKKVKWTP